jgi:hypothetical protein
LSRGVFPTTSMMAFSWLLVALLLLVLHVNNNGPHKHRGMLVQGFVLLPINTHHREVLSSSLLTRRLALLFHGNGDAPESNDHNVINNDNNNNHNNQNQQQQPQPLSKEEQQRLFDPDRLALLQRLSSVDGDGSHNETGSSPDTVVCCYVLLFWNMPLDIQIRNTHSYIFCFCLPPPIFTRLWFRCGKSTSIRARRHWIVVVVRRWMPCGSWLHRRWCVSYPPCYPRRPNSKDPCFDASTYCRRPIVSPRHHRTVLPLK